MANRKNKAASLLRKFGQVQSIIREFDAYLRTVQAENEADRICGSWVGLNGNYCPTIRKCGEGYSAMLCDNTRLYKVIVREVVLHVSGGMIIVPGQSDDETPQTVFYQSRQNRLRFGEYGVFESEEAVLRRTDSYRCGEWYDPQETM